MKARKKHFPSYLVLGILAVLVPQSSRVSAAGFPSIKLKTGGYIDETQALPKYEAVVGGKVDLPCNLTITPNDDSTSLILWYRGDNGAPIYSVDARNGPLEKAQHFPAELLGSRVYFDVTARPPVLRIQPVGEEDGGEYRCRVDHRWARTHTTASILNVIVPPNDLAILDHNGDHVHGVIGAYNEGSTLVLLCEADGGNPPPLVTWLRNNAVIDESFAILDRRVQNELRMESLERTDLMAVLTCHASNNNLTTALETSVTIDMNLKPSEVQITSLPRTLSAGKEAKLECRSTGSLPPVKITWTVDGKVAKSSREPVVFMSNFTTVSVLTFVPTANDNEKSVVCHAENTKVPNSALTNEKKLTVYHVPQASLSLTGSSKKQYIMESSDVHLTCNIKANPSVYDVSWRFQGEPLSNNPAEGLLISNNTLTLKSLRRRRKGYYRCLATNIEGTGQSEDLLLNISYSPVCRDKRKISRGVALDEVVKLSCSVDADPAEVTFFWTLNSTTNGKKITNFHSTGTNSVASYIPRTQLDYGSVFCWAKNYVGVQQEPCIFPIVAAGPPEQLKNCSVTNYTSDTISAECQPGNNGGLPQAFYLEVYNSRQDRIEMNISRPDTPSYYLTKLPSATSFILILYSANEKGKSDSVAIQASTAAVPQRRIENSAVSAISPLLGIILGIVVSLVLLIITIVVIIKIRFKVQEKGPEEEHSTEKSQPLLTKDPNFSSSTSEFRDPDVIPSKADATDFCALQDPWPTLEINSQRDNIFTCSGYDRRGEAYPIDCNAMEYHRPNDGRAYVASTFRSMEPRDAEILQVTSLSPDDVPSSDYRRIVFQSGDGLPSRYQAEMKKAEMTSTPV